MDHPHSCTRRDIGLLILRVVVAVMFLYHGYQKWGMWSATPGTMPAPLLDIFKFLSIVEPIGAIALIIGFLTEWAATGLAIIMVGAIALKINMFHVAYSAGDTTGWEFELMILASAVALALIGPGCLSVDAKMRKKK